MSSVWPSDDLLIVRITGLVADNEADLGVVIGGLGASTDKGLIALNMLGWLGVAAGLLATDNEAAGVCAGFAGVPEFGLAGDGLFAISLFGAPTVVGLADFIAGADLASLDAGMEFFGAADAVVLATKYSCALKTFKQEPQRTAPLADCSWLGVTRKAVPHLGQRVIIWVLAEVMVYLLLTHGGPLKTRLIYYRCPTV